MSISLSPSDALCFKRPLTKLGRRLLTIKNNNPHAIAFRVMTTAPNLYCSCPNLGKVEPGESIDLTVQSLPQKKEPPLNKTCKDKFLVQSAAIMPDKESVELSDIFSASGDHTIFEQKLWVVYLPSDDEPEILDGKDDCSLSHLSPPHQAMSVSLRPSDALHFQRPLTTSVERSLTITNNNFRRVVFRVETTAPKFFCPQPNSDILDPGTSIDIAVTHHALKEDPPPGAKCREKLLVQCVVLTPDLERRSMIDIWASAEKEGLLLHQKLRLKWA